MSDFKTMVSEGIPAQIPTMPAEEPGINKAPARPQILNDAEKQLALKNALRYLPPSMHAEIASEFADELAQDGRIYMRRLRPDHEMKAMPL